MKKLKIVAASLLLMLGFVTVPVFGSAAVSALTLEGCTGSDGKTIDSPTCATYEKTVDNPLTGEDGLILRIARIIALIAGVTAVLVIILGGFNYITSAGDIEKAKKAQRTVIGALIGLFIIAIASLIITFVVKRL